MSSAAVPLPLRAVSTGAGRRLSPDQVSWLRYELYERLWQARSMTAELTTWAREGLRYRMQQVVSQPPPVDIANALLIDDPTWPVEHRRGGLWTRSDEGGRLVAELDGWLYHGHPEIFGTARGRALRSPVLRLSDVLGPDRERELRRGALGLGEALYETGVQRNTVAVDAIDDLAQDGQQLVLEVRAVLSLGKPVAFVRERITAELAGRAVPQQRRRWLR